MEGGAIACWPWIDTHVHWDAAEFDVDREEALRRARQAGVIACLNPSVNVTGFKSVQQLAESSRRQDHWPLILPAFGIHPLYVGQSRASDIDVLDQQLTAHRPVAIGEIGLDGYPGAPDLGLQRPIFEAQLSMAVRHTLPVLLHVRHAVEAVIQCLKRVQGSRHKIPGGIVHAFNGSAQQAQQLIGMGFMLGFGGSLTYDGSKRIRRLAVTVPLECIVLETDAPDMSPAWLGCERNQSAELPKIAAGLANLRTISLSALSEQTCANVKRVIHWPV